MATPPLHSAAERAQRNAEKSLADLEACINGPWWKVCNKERQIHNAHQDERDRLVMMETDRLKAQAEVNKSTPIEPTTWQVARPELIRGAVNILCVIAEKGIQARFFKEAATPGKNPPASTPPVQQPVPSTSAPRPPSFADLRERVFKNSSTPGFRQKGPSNWREHAFKN